MERGNVYRLIFIQSNFKSGNIEYTCKDILKRSWKYFFLFLIIHVSYATEIALFVLIKKNSKLFPFL